MALKSFGIGVVLAGTVIAGGFVGSPVYAASFVYSETGTGNDNPLNAQLIGDPPLPGSKLNLNNNTLTIVGTVIPTDSTEDWFRFSLGGPPPGFLSVGFTSSTPEILANLLSFQLFKSLDPNNLGPVLASGNLGTVSQSVPGLFNDGDQIFARVFPNSTLPKEVTYSLAISTTPIPTPALLPGLIGMGIAAIRKRKSLLAEEAES